MLYLIIIFVLIIFLAGIIVFVYNQSKGYVVEKYELKSTKIENDFHFVFLSDLHETQHDKNNNSLLESINNLNPDAVLIGGDMITSYKNISQSFYLTLDFLKALSENNNVIYVPGNHERALMDLRDGDANAEQSAKDGSDIERINKLEEVLSENNIKLLRNENLCLNDSINIFGLDLSLMFYRRLIRRKPEISYLKNIVGNLDKDKYTIVLSHNPEHFDEYSQIGADLILSGHLHGGIVRIPGFRGVISPQLKIFPKYDSGLFAKNNCKMLISRGIGTHSIPIRIFNRAEVCDVYIKSDR